ncbi:A24 family peptidase [Stutzerimonas xanthomarina]|uniref:A24 family peptidase n=1 Tax=Stutzerimonas xanthomarina TaxID=271420 RepID=UPI0029B32CD9|nr:A24 family peptidase [Stutzerimonas xanthomarina]MDX2351020.1 A24 family peptidase [Stutzerimonas xanthomarina]
MSPLILMFTLLGIAVVSDIRHHRIPNLLILTGLALGLAGQLFTNGSAGLVDGLLGGLVGFGLFLLLYIVGGMAAGDVKLMAMAGVFLTPQHALLAAAASLIAGGLFGLALMIWHGQVRLTLGRYGLILRTHSYVAPVAGEVAGQPFPYAIAIFTGTLVSTLWFHYNF